MLPSALIGELDEFGALIFNLETLRHGAEREEFERVKAQQVAEARGKLRGR